MSLDAARREGARVAAHVDLRDVRLWSLEADLESVPDLDETRLSYGFNADVTVQHSAENAMLMVVGRFTLNMDAVRPEPDPAEEAAEAEDDSVATIAFNLNALFEVEVEPDEPFTESELSAFGQTTGQFALYPYARELVANLTGRMGLPALHMGVMRLNLETRDG